MNKKSLFFTSILYLLCSVNGYSTKLEEIEDKIKDYQAMIKKAHESADADALKKVDQQFKDLDFEERDLEDFANKQNPPIFKWSIQDKARQRVGGWLFYPKEFDETQVEISGEKKVVPWGFLDNPYQIRLTERIDYIWALTIASQHKHPVAQYYLCQAMIQALTTQENNASEDRKGQYAHPELSSLEKIYNQCIKDLQKDVELNQDAKDIIAYLPLFRWDNSVLDLVMNSVAGKSPNQDTIKEAARKLATLSLRSQLRSLEAKKNCAIFAGQVSQQSFLDLGKNYAPAYQSLVNNFWRNDGYDYTKTEEYLQEAIQSGYLPTCVNLGQRYIAEGNRCIKRGKKEEGEEWIQKGKKCFEEAKKNNISEFYVEQGIQLLGKNPVTLSTIKQVLSKGELGELKKGNVPKKITDVLEFFKEAADLKDPQGYYLNAHLNRHMLEYYEAIKKPSSQEKDEKEKYESAYKDSLREAAKLGSREAYCWVENYLDKEEFKKIKQTHPPLYDGLWEELMKYIDNTEETKTSQPSTSGGAGSGPSRVSQKGGNRKPEVRRSSRLQAQTTQKK